MKSDKMNVIEVEGKEGSYYVEKESIIDKYLRRPTCLNISLSQFVKRYEPVRKIPKKYSVKQFYIDVGKLDVYLNEKDAFSYESDDDSDSDNEFDTVVNEEKLIPINEHEKIFDGEELDLESSTALPPFIPLIAGNDAGAFKWMKKRKPKAIRFHKFNRVKDPHQWYFSEMLLYLPFSNEEELFPENFDKCKALYDSKLDQINNIRGHVMPYLKSVIEARDRAHEFLSNIGDQLDPNKEQIDEEDRAEGITEHPDLGHKDPTDYLVDEQPENNTFRRIELQSESEIFAKLRTLDKDQRQVVDVMYNYARQFQLAKKHKNNAWPTPPLLMVHGGAGTGKSHVIDCVSQLLEKVFRTPGDNPNHPYILKLAFTGNAASIINGQTIHSAFQLPFGNNHVTMNDKVRDMRRKQLQNLCLIIMDEVSLIKSDIFYQIHFRLMEIFQNRLDFGNIAILALGDVLQIKPPLGSMIYACPKNQKSKSLWQIPGGKLWEKFEAITLKTNHRQGEDMIYANLLNRIRIGEHTDDDIEILNSRVFPRDSSELPTDALLITGTNAIVNSFNNKKLNELSGELIEITADVRSRTRGIFKPKVTNAGLINNSPLPYVLKVKKHARVMLTVNFDVCDNLSNGALGEIIDFKRNSRNEVEIIFVKFDNETAGEQHRKHNNFDKQYPGMRATAIKKMEFEFQLRKGSDSTATATTFPLTLAWASTCHKIQGHTVKKPKKLMLDLVCWLEPAMVYVALSRVQSLDQLYILEKLPVDKINPWVHAVAEMERLDLLDEQRKKTYTFKLVSMNTNSLQAHYDDILVDNELVSSNVLCLQESWTKLEDTNLKYPILERTCHLNSVRRGAGLATYFTPEFSHLKDITSVTYQITAITSENVTIINIYRSSQANNEIVIKSLSSIIENQDKSIIVCGDFNFCHRDERNHPIYSYLSNNNFNPALEPSLPTHREGRCLDNIWIRNFANQETNAYLNFVYYTDHGQTFLTF